MSKLSLSGMLKKCTNQNFKHVTYILGGSSLERFTTTIGGHLKPTNTIQYRLGQIDSIKQILRVE